MTPFERSEVRRREVQGPYKEPTQPKPITEEHKIGFLLASLLVGSGTYLAYNPGSIPYFLAGFVTVSIITWRVKKLLKNN